MGNVFEGNPFPNLLRRLHKPRRLHKFLSSSSSGVPKTLLPCLDMGNICWQCGDIGISEALLYCSRCKSNPRHSYCLHELMFNYCLDELPEDLSAGISWLCEDCMIKFPNFTSQARFPECSPRLLLHCSGKTTIGPKDACQVIGAVNDHSVNPQDQHLITNVRIVSSVNLDNHVSYDTKKVTLSCRNGDEPGTVSPSSCTELSEDGIGEYGKENPERKSFMPLEKDESSKSIHPVHSQDTDIQFQAKRIPVTSVEAHDMQLIKQTSDFDTGGLGAGRSSPCSGPREDEIKDSEKGRLQRRGSTLLAKEYLDSFRPLVDGKRRRRGKRSRLILLSKLDNYHFLFDGKGTNSSFAVQSLPCTPVERFGREIIERPTSCTTYRIGAERSSIRYKEKKYKFGKYRKNISKERKSKLPAKDEFGNYYPYGQSTNVACTVKRVSITSVEPYNTHAMGRTLTGDVNTLTPLNSSVCFGRLIPGAKVHSTSEDECASASSSIEPSACFELKPVQAGHCKEKLLRRKYIKSGMKMVDSTHPLSDVQSISIETLDNQGIDASDAVRSSSIPPAMKDQMRMKRMIPPAKGESDNDLEINILFASDGQTEEVEISQYGKEKTDRRRSILNDNNEFSSLHTITDSQGSSKMFADKSLPGGTVVISDVKTWRTDMNDQINFSCPQAFRSLPIVPHVWRGTFSINKREFGPFRAHLSSRACEKARNLARKLPLVLYMQMLPRLVGWPNSFKASAPTDDSVALYFSPESDRAESSLDEVVDDIINNDLMLRFQFDEVELLIFSSSVLPQRSQILYGKYYAWGVFKRRSAQVCSSPAVSHALPDGVSRRNEAKGNVDMLLLKDHAEEINYLPFGSPSIRSK
ncbi:hypothetical protein KSP39_PZI014605 [Platanthera zijinensis]|uniref:AIPP2-like SPOC-like domain-containing protein n=1 Tax=Platanthera zijinensis TaxID=2320716 RepID=A0AAP0BAT8_9ASPA